MSKFDQFRLIIVLALCASTLGICAVSNGQRPRFPDFFGSTGSAVVAPGTAGAVLGNQPPALAVPNFGQTGTPAFTNPTIGAPPVILQGPVQQSPPIFGQPTLAFPPSTSSGTVPNFQPPSLNPFQIPNQSFPGFPNGGPGVQNFQIYPPANSQPLVGPQIAPPPVRTVPNYQPPAINRSFPNNGVGQPFFDNGIGRSGLLAWPQRAWSSFQNDFLPRLLERPRARQTFIRGDNGNQLNINDIEVATTLNWPNFFQSNEALLVSPGFIFHFWDGPDSATGFDLPPRTYSAYLSFDHSTDTRRNFGLENNFTVGFYSDFDAVSSDSLRLTGKLLGWRRINSYMIGKFGVEYLDRIRTKLLPAFGIYATPTPDIKLDLYFPRTKLSHRIPNLNDFEVWAYAGAEYGGGSWTIERTDGTEDQVDLNDIRTFIGLEWIGPRRVSGFLEFGYVASRELVYKSDSLNEFDLEDAVMVRSGLAF